MVKTISDQNSAMEEYLNDLLSPAEPLVKTAGVASLSLVQKATPAGIEVIIDSEPKSVDSVEVMDNHELAEKPVKKIEAPVPEGDPDWASEIFSVYVCTVINVKLAIPSNCVEQPFEYTTELKQLANSPDWVMGLKMSEDGFVAIVDTAALLLKQPLRNASSTQYKQVLVIKNSRWGLAVDSLTEEVEVTSADVRWRQQATTRQWLCGTDSKQQLAFVDTRTLFVDNP